MNNLSNKLYTSFLQPTEIKKSNRGDNIINYLYDLVGDIIFDIDVFPTENHIFLGSKLIISSDEYPIYHVLNDGKYNLWDGSPIFKIFAPYIKIQILISIKNLSDSSIDSSIDSPTDSPTDSSPLVQVYKVDIDGGDKDKICSYYENLCFSKCITGIRSVYYKPIRSMLVYSHYVVSKMDYNNIAFFDNWYKPLN